MSKHIHCFGKNQQEPKCKDIVQMSIFNGAVHFYSLIIFHLRNSYHPSVSQFSTHRVSYRRQVGLFNLFWLKSAVTKEPSSVRSCHKEHSNTFRKRKQAFGEWG